jgi:CoA transferase family III
LAGFARERHYQATHERKRVGTETGRPPPRVRSARDAGIGVTSVEPTGPTHHSGAGASSSSSSTDFVTDRPSSRSLNRSVRRPGFYEVGAAVSGLFALEGTPTRPKQPVIVPIADNVVGWLGTTGILTALRRRAVEGGSYRVTVSLTRTVLWLLSLGIFDKAYAQATAGSSDEHPSGGRLSLTLVQSSSKSPRRASETLRSSR